MKEVKGAHILEQPIRLADNSNDPAELKKLAEWIGKTERLTMGPLVEEFEGAVADKLGIDYVIMVNSGSSALMLALYGLLESGRLSNQRVVVPAISWVTTVSPIIHFGMEPILCDCDIRTLGPDLDHVEAIFKREKPAAMIVVYVLGHAPDMKRLLELCGKHEVVLIEDCCEAFGTIHDRKYAGTFGDVSAFSLYYGHQLSSVEGGFVATRDRACANVIRSLRAHGWGRDVEPDIRRRWEAEYKIDDVRSLYTFYYPGFNCRPTEINAFLAKSQLNKLDDVVRKRERIYREYVRQLGGRYWIQMSDTDKLSSFAFGTLVENRLEVYRHLQEKQIETRPLIAGSMGRQPFWIRRYGEKRIGNADVVHENGIYLPIHAGMDIDDVRRVALEFSSVARPKAFD